VKVAVSQALWSSLNISADCAAFEATKLEFTRLPTSIQAQSGRTGYERKKGVIFYRVKHYEKGICL